MSVGVVLYKTIVLTYQHTGCPRFFVELCNSLFSGLLLTEPEPLKSGLDLGLPVIQLIWSDLYSVPKEDKVVLSLAVQPIKTGMNQLQLQQGV